MSRELKSQKNDSGNSTSQGKILVGLHDRLFFLRLVGDVRVTWCVSLESYCEAVIKKSTVEQVCVDLSPTENLDSTTLGVLAKIAVISKRECGIKPVLICQDESILRLLRSMAFDAIFDIRAEHNDDDFNMDDLPFIDCQESKIQETVISAHKALMGMSEENRDAFCDLVKALEQN